jgi:hypothetical protein
MNPEALNMDKVWNQVPSMVRGVAVPRRSGDLPRQQFPL